MDRSDNKEVNSINQFQFNEIDSIYKGSDGSIRKSKYIVQNALKYVHFIKNTSKITLDGDFTIEELQYFIDIMSKKL